MLDVQILRDVDNRVVAVTLDKVNLAKLPSPGVRSIWVDAARTIVVKIDGRIGQAQQEAQTWMNLDPIERSYFATPLQVGTNYIVQEFVPLEKHPHHEDEFESSEEACDVYEQAYALFEQYDLDWDWQGWNQFGIDKRTGLLCIHDYPCFEAVEPTTHSWSTINVAEAA